VDEALARLKRAAESNGRRGAAGTTGITVELSAAELERLSLLAQELAASPSEALRQLASRGRQGWPWLLAIDLRIRRARC